ncbi:MAG TPA: very short patch repair endonuclease [Candidatus Hydrogenedentes bacterium]|nr:very short patch repair endonuclease [Candidatus Hydrogenedentota bacterium]HOV74907.1 very short patch repair endonuclease [Candidatus Hydrogenedentota bacterium]HPC17531.1 very short patch repair endonuclease [Candidatus Hydrogenedentota bacterium]HRT20628.1 very short patch repair endonuclease [Candidatus Hydrogenedentota bacterium]HRT65365.1 very short patch repair endonuclease [Candidatus Hydrogenedentota bacterium]
MDNLTPEHRSWLMRRVRSKNTTPELLVRRIAHSMGLRFRLHRRDLPGTPDLVFPAYNRVVFVHGCFWHRHRGCRFTTTPKTRVKYWKEKFQKNMQRDLRNARKLRRSGWRILVIWQCQTRDVKTIESKLRKFFDE